jgi:hypothetical protein
VLSLESLRRNLRGWYLYHVKTRGWADIGYQTCTSLTVDGPVIVDLRGIGRVPAAHASASNPRANWHGGANLWTIGNTEIIEPELIEAYQDFRTRVWLPRWPTGTGVTHHRLVPGAQTSCAGNQMDGLVRSGILKKAPPTEEDMATLDSDDLAKIRGIVHSEVEELLKNALFRPTGWQSPGVLSYMHEAANWGPNVSLRYLLETALERTDISMRRLGADVGQGVPDPIVLDDPEPEPDPT